MEALGHIIGGIGVFFVGLYLLSTALKLMAGRSFRLHFAKWVGTDLKATAVGFWGGFFCQSMSALSFIIGSMVGAGMLHVRRGMLIIFWANAGTGIMIVLAVLNIKLVVLFLLGFAGISFAMKMPARHINISQALFGGALLFYGLIMLRAGAAPLATTPFFAQFLEMGQSSYMLSFIAGALLTAISQSSTAVSILAISLTQAGIISMEQTIMVIYGANLGSGLISWLLAAGIKGKPKQLIMSQVFFNFAAAMVFVPLFYLELLTGIPGIYSLVVSLPFPIEQQAAMVFLIFNFGGAIFLSLIVNHFFRLIEHIWPETVKEKWSQPEYIRDDIPSTPEITMALIHKEQQSMLQRLTHYSAIMIGQEKNKDISADVLHKSFSDISKEINSHAAETARQNLSCDGTQQLLITQDKQKQMESLEELLYSLNQKYEDLSQSLKYKFQDTFLQSLDFLLQTLMEAEKSSQPDDAGRIIEMTRDKGQVFQSIRKAYLSKEASLSHTERNRILELTSIFERIIWSIGAIARQQHSQKISSLS
ncbi:Na/Pi cotransporter family protein [Desulfonatronovibrio magnus]|uniref:Na/Pi cotransporter family protein n=1 Tax=Desulfonatronovibrio magnus TaxID=698827 RepID=UPI0005EB5C78|nr:Na/Pi symporter [Desulfonatronovibrio magnus]